MANPLRVGVIGLGRRWRCRYRPALRALRECYAIRAVADEVFQRTEREARQLGCDAVAGPTALLERDDVDAVILADAQWFGLWSVEAACRLGKPVFCAVPLYREEARAEALVQQVTASGLPVMVEMLPRHAPVTAPLRRLLHNTLGPVRLVLGEVVQAADDPADGAMAVLDWCVCLLESTPVSAQAAGIDSAGVRSQFWEMAAGWGLQIVQRRAAGVKPALRLKVLADKGTAQVVLPRRLAWTEADGRHTHLLPRGQPLVQVQLAKFAEAVRGKESVTPDLRDAYRQLEWLRAVQRSQTEGRRVSLASEEP